ncbi:uncharacterized protein EV422DRAFT_282004 [Fimicolochytrium jonesii]|uniref:uncharacterized protein n=1 Tax=Fimicolochytrium jonesii TaxID=1396493 RepID=UPI0022FF1B9D|nr:uncharacterized protein EV422DRAFT_282004 [Fimicolochytrium jonesii]KAI8816640.1 hypothetical protein EV422DRAFT_282004 [Fimicolochytrium jonesii]
MASSRNRSPQASHCCTGDDKWACRRGSGRSQRIHGVQWRQYERRTGGQIIHSCRRDWECGIRAPRYYPPVHKLKLPMTRVDCPPPLHGPINASGVAINGSRERLVSGNATERASQALFGWLAGEFFAERPRRRGQKPGAISDDDSDHRSGSAVPGEVTNHHHPSASIRTSKAATNRPTSTDAKTNRIHSHFCAESVDVRPQGASAPVTTIDVRPGLGKQVGSYRHRRNKTPTDGKISQPLQRIGGSPSHGSLAAPISERGDFWARFWTCGGLGGDMF